MPYCHREYDTVSNTLGSLYPQGFTIDKKAKELLVVSGIGHVTVWDLDTFEYKLSYKLYNFIDGNGKKVLQNVSESIVIVYNKQSRYVLLRGGYVSENEGILYYDITNVNHGDEIYFGGKALETPAQMYFSKYGNRFVFSADNTVHESSGDYRYYTKFFYGTWVEDTMTIDVDNTSMTVLPIMETRPSLGGEGDIAKIQGMCWDGERFICSMGGSWKKSHLSGRYGTYGSRVFDRKGNILNEQLIDPPELSKILEDKGYNIERIEAEGVYVDEDTGKIYTLMVTDNTSRTEGLLLIELFAGAYDDGAINVSKAQAKDIFGPNPYDYGGLVYPTQTDGSIVDPITGNKIKSWADVLLLMRKTNTSDFKYYDRTGSLEPLVAENDYVPQIIDGVGRLIHFQSLSEDVAYITTYLNANPGLLHRRKRFTREIQQYIVRGSSTGSLSAFLVDWSNPGWGANIGNVFIPDLKLSDVLLLGEWDDPNFTINGTIYGRRAQEWETGTFSVALNIRTVADAGIAGRKVYYKLEYTSKDDRGDVRLVKCSYDGKNYLAIDSNSDLNALSAFGYNYFSGTYRGDPVTKVPKTDVSNILDLTENDLGYSILNGVKSTELYRPSNTTVDSNGFIKVASPVVKLYSNKIEKTECSELQNVYLEVAGVGHYVLRCVPLLSRDGWYIETPKDRNNNVYFTIDYEEKDGDVIIRTYEPDYSEGAVKNGKPIDIIEGRYVSLRFSEDEVACP